jgi:hypothetical protein
MTTSRAKFSHDHRRQIKELALRDWKLSGDAGRLADIVFMDNWTLETEVLRDEICRLILKGYDPEVPLRETKYGRAIIKQETYRRVLWHMKKHGLKADPACIEVADERNESVETIRTRYKSAKDDPRFDDLRDYGWNVYETE